MITAGASRVASGPLCVHAIAITPASSMELVRSSISIDCGLPPETVGSAPAIVFSGPAQRSLHVTACTLAESPSDPLHRGLRQLCCLRCRLDCYRVERTSSRAGVSPAEVQRLSRRTVSPTISGTGRSTTCGDTSGPCDHFFFDFFPGRVVRLNVVVENLDELGHDLVAFQGGKKAAVHVDGGFRFFKCSGQ